MSLILIVDDMAIVREPIAASLRNAGYETICAPNGREALTLVRERRPDLILLDINMPVMDGFTFLQTLRRMPNVAQTPVLLLSSDGDKEHVTRAAKLGVKGYLLKTRFSLAECLSRIEKHLTPMRTAGIDAEGQERRQETPKAGSVPSLLSREDALQRASNAMQGRTLSGVVSQVVSVASSPNGDAAQLAQLIARDAILSARVLRAANSAAYSGGRGTVSTIPDAIRKIGSKAVRDIAMAVGIFNAMPAPSPDGFNPIRSWQHSFAVATLCEHLARTGGSEKAGNAYLVGLCHDLGAILFQNCFASQYQKVLEFQARSGVALEELERAMLGITRSELILKILSNLSLPPAMLSPIEAFHKGTSLNGEQQSLLAILGMAEWCANGMLLASSETGRVGLITRQDARAACGADDPPCPDPDALRGEIAALTSVLGRFGPADDSQILSPLFPHTENRICVVRAVSLSDLDPVVLALRSVADVAIEGKLPDLSVLDGYSAVVVESVDGLAGSAGERAITELSDGCRSHGTPFLWVNAGRTASGQGAAATSNTIALKSLASIAVEHSIGVA